MKSVITDVSSVTNTIATAKTSLASKSRRDSTYEEVNQKEILSSAVKNDWDPIPSICMLNGSHVTASSQTELQRQFETIIGNEVDTSTSPCLDLIEKQLSVCHKTQKTKQKTVILIIDEIDLVLLAPGTVQVLDRLFRWCLSPTHAFTIVRISNVVTCKWMSKCSSIDGLKEVSICH